MTSVGDVRAALETIRGRLAEEQRVVKSTMAPLASAYVRLTAAARGSGSNDLHQAATQANSASNKVINALEQIDFADTHLGEYLANCL